MSNDDVKEVVNAVVSFNMVLGDEAILQGIFQQSCFLLMRQGLLENALEFAQEMLKQDRMHPADKEAHINAH